MTIEEDQSNTTESNKFEIAVTDEETKIREEIANDFYNLISQIKVPFTEIFTLRKKKIRPYSKEAVELGIGTDSIYFLFDEEEEQKFFQNITDLNETLGAANSTLDSYIKFTKSSPDFEKFLNMFYIFVENYTNYRASFFFQANAEKGNYLYPYFEVDNVLVKLRFLFARLCGTLSVGARWTVIQPPVSHSPMGGEYYGGEPYRPFYDAHDPYRYSYGEQQKPKYRDIGDAYEGQR